MLYSKLLEIDLRYFSQAALPLSFPTRIIIIDEKPRSLPLSGVVIDVNAHPRWIVIIRCLKSSPMPMYLEKTANLRVVAPT